MFGAVYSIGTLKQRLNGRDFVAEICKRILFNENIRIVINIRAKFVSKGKISNIAALIYITYWRRAGGKPLSEPMMV